VPLLINSRTNVLERQKHIIEDMVRVATLYKEVTNFMQAALRVSEDFAEMRAFWEEPDQYSPIPQCHVYLYV